MIRLLFIVASVQEVLKVEGLPIEELVFTMSNYFSMGVESRIGRGFDRHRTKSQTLNKVVGMIA